MSQILTTHLTAVAAYTEAAGMDLDAWRTPGAMWGSVTISLGQLAG